MRPMPLMPSLPPLRIVIAQPSQAAEISRLIQGLAHYFVAAADSAAAQPFLSTFQPEAIGALLANPAYRYHAATAGDAMLGVCALRDHRHVHHLFVASDAHGQGVARSLWSHADADARAHGGNGAYAVNSSVYAVPVYERLGFVATGPVQTRNGVRFVPMAKAS